MSTATMTSKGQITIPKEVRAAVGLDTGQRVSFRVRADGVVEMRPENVDLLSLCGIIKPKVKGVTLKDMEEAIRRGAAEG
jgi:AbrB family looped-hinge helix DNA binding protein